MRYYDIVISENSTGKPIKQFTSFPNGKTDPAALDIEFDLPTTSAHIPQGAATLKIWGITRDDIRQSSNYNPANSTSTQGKMITIAGGMQKGLPLANPKQAGILITGLIQQAFGNWIGTEMTLDFVIQYGPTTGLGSSNIVPVWKKGTKLADAMKATISTAFPGVKFSIDISPKLVLNNDEPGFYGSLLQFITYVNDISRKIIPEDNYQGVFATIQNNTFIAFDGTSEKAPRIIGPQDMVGQITWINPNTIIITTVMRADLTMGDFVRVPPGQQQISGAAIYRDQMTFSGIWQIIAVRHVGRFRAPSGTAWISVFTAISADSSVKP